MSDNDLSIILLSLLFLFVVSFTILIIISSLPKRPGSKAESEKTTAIYFLALAGSMFSFLEMLVLLLTGTVDLTRLAIIMGISLIVAAFMTTLRKLK